ncbi:MAG: hypothetical protein IKH54_06725 [Bacilli bacterium]|nr:hypothetical protein [Bacilli bacterium]
MKKKSLIIIIVVVFSLVVLSLLGASIYLFITGDSTSGKMGILPKKEEVKITKDAAKTIEYEKYDNGLVSFNKPKGWEVVVAPFDYIHYSFKVYDPSNPTYMFLFGMKLEGYNKSWDAKNWQQTYYPGNLFAQLPVIDPQNTDGFYKVWNETAEYVNKNDAKSNYLPLLNDFSVVEDLGTNEIGGNVLRATYTDSSNKKAQGLFTANVMSAGTYYVYSNPFNWSSGQIDVWPLNVYNIVLMSAPDEEFVNWQPVLDKCLGTIQFSDEFINGFNKEESSILNTIQANQKVYDQMSDMIMDSWEKRNNSYDIISQKQSDATLGYERVYDTETGDIYKADIGFTDHDWNGRYEPVTDDMYNLPTSGYIEKVD